MINFFDNTTKNNFPVGSVFRRYDDHIVLRRQATYELQIPEM